MRALRPSVRLRDASRSITAAALLVLAACAGGGDAVAGPGNGSGNGPGNGSGNGSGNGDRLPAALVGDWYMSEVGNTNYYDAATGSWSSPSGKGNKWQFTADGHYTHATLYQVSFYGCLSRVFWWDEGTVDEAGGRITFHSARATIKSESTCNPANNYERPSDGAAGTAPYAVATAGGKPTLTITFGADAVETFVQQ